MPWPVYRGQGSDYETSIPAIEGNALDETWAERIPFLGYHLPVNIGIREENRVMEARDGAPTRVIGICGWTIEINGVLVYGSGGEYVPSASAAFLNIPHVLARLFNHPVRWWERASWFGRPVYFQGVPATITDFTPMRGTALVVPQAGLSFRWPPGMVTEEGEAPDEDRVAAIVNIIDGGEITWTRMLPLNEPRPSPAPPERPQA